MAKFTEDEHERGCRALVLSDGNVTRARGALLALGIDVAERTLRDWLNSPRYAELKADRDWIFDDIAQGSSESIALAAQAEVKLLHSVLADLDAGKFADTSPNVRLMAAKAASTVKGINIDKLNDILGRPKRPDGNVSELPGMIRELARLGVKVDIPIDTTAEEIPEELEAGTETGGDDGD